MPFSRSSPPGYSYLSLGNRFLRVWGYTFLFAPLCSPTWPCMEGWDVYVYYVVITFFLVLRFARHHPHGSAFARGNSDWSSQRSRLCLHYLCARLEKIHPKKFIHVGLCVCRTQSAQGAVSGDVSSWFVLSSTTSAQGDTTVLYNHFQFFYSYSSLFYTKTTKIQQRKKQKRQKSEKKEMFFASLKVRTRTRTPTQSHPLHTFSPFCPFLPLFVWSPMPGRHLSAS